MVTLCLYIDKVYIKAETKDVQVYQILLIIAIIYPFWYETIQMFRMGVSVYLSELANYLDLLYIYGGIANVVLQNTMDPFGFPNKLLMSIILLQ